MRTQYTHHELGKDIIAGIATYYTPEKEGRLRHNGKEVLYVRGQAVVESSCCGSGSWRYVVVPGYVVSWQSAENEAGRPVSEVESISDEAARAAIKQRIATEEDTPLIEFW